MIKRNNIRLKECNIYDELSKIDDTLEKDKVTKREKNIRPNFDRTIRENNNGFFDELDEMDKKKAELDPIFQQIENILKYEYLEKKNMVVTMVTTIEGVRAIYIAGGMEEEYLLAIYVRKNKEDFVNFYGEKVNPFEASVDVSAIALIGDVKVFNVCFDLYTQLMEGEDIVGRFYANDNRYYYSAPYGVMVPIVFQPMEPMDEDI